MSKLTPRSIMISSMPKSGTTWMYHLLLEITGHSEARLYGDPLVGSEIDTARIVHASRNHAPWVAMMHVCPGDYAAQLMEQCNAIPIVLTRNIFDSLVSFHDEIVKVIESKQPPLTTMIHIPDNFLEWNPEKRIDFLITIYVPWVTFFLSRWVDYRGEKYWITYERILENTKGNIKSILEKTGMKIIPDEEIENKIKLYDNKNKDKTRFNQGITGRGDCFISDQQKKNVIRIFSFYSNLDPVNIGVIRDDQMALNCC